jgi:acyl-CoA carboxylase epsilon subunit
VNAPEDGGGRTDHEPLIRVVSGQPSAEELAAVVAVLAAAGGAASPPPRARLSLWAARERGLRGPIHPGPGAWRATYLPR